MIVKGWFTLSPSGITSLIEHLMRDTPKNKFARSSSLSLDLSQSLVPEHQQEAYLFGSILLRRLLLLFLFLSPKRSIWKKRARARSSISLSLDNPLESFKPKPKSEQKAFISLLLDSPLEV